MSSTICNCFSIQFLVLFPNCASTIHEILCLVHKVTNQKTGISKNVYQKPKLLVKNKKGKVKQTNSDVLEGQLSFNDLKTNDKAKPMNSVITSLLTKIFPNKK